MFWGKRDKSVVSFVGAYRVIVSSAERDAALACHQSDETFVDSELRSVALIELEVRNADAMFAIDSISQVHVDCPPYNVEYFDANSLERLQVRDDAVLRLKNFRVAFHVHFFDPTKPFNTPYGLVSAEPLKEAPAYLKDKPYVYWD